jgi:hypothetical protein
MIAKPRRRGAGDGFDGPWSARPCGDEADQVVAPARFASAHRLLGHGLEQRTPTGMAVLRPWLVA